MQRERTSFNSPATHKASFGIVQYFIAVDITMVVGRWYRKRMIIKKPGHKRADHKIAGLKRLMYRWWLMYAPGDRLKIINGKSVRPQKSIPPNQVKRTMLVNILMQVSLFFYL